MKAITKNNLFKIGFKAIDEQHVFYVTNDLEKRISIYFDEDDLFLIALDRHNKELESNEHDGFEEVIHLTNCILLQDIVKLMRIL